MTAEFEQLLESGLLDEETTSVIKEAIDQKVKEKLEEQKDELREEFARRYEYDKKVMIEAADKMFNEALANELKDLRSEKQKHLESKVEYKKMVRDHAKKIQEFVSARLREEVKELREDRKGISEALVKFEQFAVKHLSKELSEFHEDKRDLVETKVKLVKGAKEKVDETKKEFVKRAAVVVEAFLETRLREEIGSFRKDIREARKNNFGRRIFEAFAAEFLTSHASDGTERKKLVNTVKERENKLAEALELVKKQTKVQKGLNHKLKIAENRLARTKKLNELLGPLPKDKKEIMEELLDNVDTQKLDEAYKRHIKFVLNEDSKPHRKPLRESRREVTGDRKNLNEQSSEAVEDDDLVRLRVNAGIN